MTATVAVVFPFTARWAGQPVAAEITRVVATERVTGAALLAAATHAAQWLLDPAVASMLVDGRRAELAYDRDGRFEWRALVPVAILMTVERVP